MQEYPQMLYHPDGRKTVARDQQHHAELAMDGYCAIDKAGKLIQTAPDTMVVPTVTKKIDVLLSDPPISEMVRDMAEAHGIDWRAVDGTGQNGRVLKSDVQKLIDGHDHQDG